jgi:hypothetical protein
MLWLPEVYPSVHQQEIKKWGQTSKAAAPPSSSWIVLALWFSVLLYFTEVTIKLHGARGNAYVFVILSCVVVIAEPTHDVNLYGS